MFNIIVNPIAGRGKTRRAFKQVTEVLYSKRILYKAFFSQNKGEISSIAAELEKKGEKDIIIIGGEGSLNELLNGVKNPKKMNFGIIPCGTGNDFAKSAGIPINPKKAILNILNGNIKKLDYLESKEARAINTLSIGIDVDVITKYNKSRFKNKFTYYTALIKTLLNFKFHSMQFDIDGKEEQEGEYFVAVASNGKYFGGGMKVSPNSRLDDGKIHFVAIKAIPKAKIPFVLAGFLKGKHIEKPYTKEYICEHVVSNTLKEGNTQTVNYDGELRYNSVFDVKIVKEGMNIYL